MERNHKNTSLQDESIGLFLVSKIMKTDNTQITLQKNCVLSISIILDIKNRRIDSRSFLGIKK